MLIVGDIISYNELANSMDINKFTILNLSSMSEGFERVRIVPSFFTEYDNDIDFDLALLNHIFSNDSVFMEFMKIIYALYNGCDVFLLVSRNEIQDIFTESICKLIQQRYGYNYQFINEAADINYYDDSTFNLNGIQNLSMDKERMTYLSVQANPDILKG